MLLSRTIPPRTFAVRQSKNLSTHGRFFIWQPFHPSPLFSKTPLFLQNFPNAALFAPSTLWSPFPFPDLAKSDLSPPPCSFPLPLSPGLAPFVFLWVNYLPSRTFSESRKGGRALNPVVCPKPPLSYSDDSSQFACFGLARQFSVFLSPCFPVCVKIPTTPLTPGLWVCPHDLL